MSEKTSENLEPVQQPKLQKQEDTGMTMQPFDNIFPMLNFPPQQNMLNNPMPFMPFGDDQTQQQFLEYQQYQQFLFQQTMMKNMQNMQREQQLFNFMRMQMPEGLPLPMHQSQEDIIQQNQILKNYIKFNEEKLKLISSDSQNGSGILSMDGQNGSQLQKANIILQNNMPDAQFQKMMGYNEEKLEIKQEDNGIQLQLQQGTKSKNSDKITQKKQRQFKQNSSNSDKGDDNPINLKDYQLQMNPKDKIDIVIWKQNIRPHTGHVPTNFMNILIPHLLNIWKKKIPCKNGRQFKELNACDCSVCKEFDILKVMKSNRKNVNLNAFSKLWKNPRIRAISEDFIQNFSLNIVLDHSGYRNPVTRISLLLCLKYFQINVKNPQEFYKLSA